MGKKNDLTGQRFGRLVVLRELEDKPNKNGYIWECKCDCGNIKKTRGNNLKYGFTNSCGCLAKELSTIRNKKLFKKDITGERFGRLTAVRDSGEKTKHGQSNWFCDCDCGADVLVAIGSLSSGNIKSCGCFKRDVNPYKKAKNKNNTSGVTGVSFDKKYKKWVATLNFKGDNVLKKKFSDKQDAIQARKEAEEKYFKPILEKYGKESK